MTTSRLRSTSLRPEPGLFLAGFLLFYASLSIVISPIQYDKISAGFQLASFTGAFLIGMCLRELRLFWLALALVLTAEVGLQVTQILGLELVYDTATAPFGTFGNVNFLATALAVGIAGALAYKLWWFVPVGFAGLWMSGSRAGFAAGGIALIVHLWKKPFLPISILAVFGITVFVVLSQPKTGASDMLRLGVWQDTLTHLTFFGHGFGSFFEYYQTLPVHTIPALILPNHAYSDIIEIMSDLGIASLALWVLAIMVFDKANKGTRVILLTFFVLACVYFPLHTPLTGQILFLTIGAHYALQTQPATLRRRSLA